MTTENIVNYTDHEINNFKNGKVKIIQQPKDVKEFIEQSIKVSSNKKLYFGKISVYFARNIKKNIKIDITGYNISLKSDAIRHIMNHHSKKIEDLRGQIPVFKDDFLLIPLIIINHNYIYLSGISKGGKPSIKFKYQENDIMYCLVTYLSDKSKSIEVQTMYKIKLSK